MLTLIRCNDIYSDPRAMKYVRYLNDNNIPYQMIGWDRENIVKETVHATFYKKKAGYNVGGLKAAFNRVGWMLYVIKELRKNSEKNVVLHCCDLDAAFPAVIYKKFFNKKAYIIFDVFDWFSASMSSQNAFIVWCFKKMEAISMKGTDHYFICEPERKDQFPVDVPDGKISIFPNIPSFSNSSFLKLDDRFKFNNELITFSYVGYFSDERCIDEIITIASKGYVNLLIAGYGSEKIENRLRSLEGCSNIRYFGKVKYEDGLNIMYNSDIVYAMYSKVVPNHVYAAPNKYYEAMFIGRPIFTTSGTFVGKKVLNNGLGFISEESESDISLVIENLTKEDLRVKGHKAHQMWEAEYSTYTENFLSTKYRQLIGE